jgi:uroporphyrinogen decarboxylase
MNLTPRESFIHALERRLPSGRVPHFELVFFLTMEAFGKVHPEHRNYRQWDQMTRSEQRLHRRDIADTYVLSARRFEHSAILAHMIVGTQEEQAELINEIRRQSDGEFFLMLHGDPTFAVPDGDSMLEWSYRTVDDPQGLKDEAARRVDRALERARFYRENSGLDGFALCSDYCFNTGPFLSPPQFAEFVAPYLRETIAGYRELGFYTIKHTDGNIMPIVDQLVDAGPHALHSLDPQGGVDIAEVKRRYGDQVCLIGNVNCGLMDSGTDTDVEASARYALQHGMPGGGYIFSTSNCVYTGMRLERYELILDVWRRYGEYS